MATAKNQAGSIAVLASGGVESAAMICEALQRYERVYPVYVRQGFRWERAELIHLRSVLRAFRADGLARLKVLELPVGPVYEKHWSLGVSEVPGFKDPDSSVYLPGRNLMLLSLAGTYCSIRRIPTLWIGVLKGNPFQDARTGFFRQVEGLLDQAIHFSVRIASPLQELTKGQVLARWPQVPWEKTLSCIRPAGRRHCGKCQKCAERQKGFQAAGVKDGTSYAGKA